MNLNGETVYLAKQNYKIDVPEKGYAEQSPESWWTSTVLMLKELLHNRDINPESIAGIGLSGQMHGLVLLDKTGAVVRPAIIWSDQRSKDQIDQINRVITKEKLVDHLLNRVSTGFAVASLLWVKENEPESYEKAEKMLLPKDYIRFRLTGELGTEATDASSSLAFNVAKRKWATDFIHQLGLKDTLFPPCFEPFDVAGGVTERVARETGLKKGTPVVFGAGDQFMQAVGNGLISPGLVSSNIGTGGQLAVMVNRPAYDQKLRTNTFCHIKPNTWNIQGSSLNAGLSLEWLKSNILKEKEVQTLENMAEKVAPGSEGLVFLPYLTGERTPHLNPNAEGIFFGLTLRTTDAHMVRAVMEGVIYALKDSLELIEALGIQPSKLVASGGGSKSRLWRQMQADLFDKPVYTTKTTEEASVGAAITAGVGVGLYSSVEEACSQLISFHSEVFEPIKQNQRVYLERYALFKELYKRNEDLFLR